MQQQSNVQTVYSPHPNVYANQQPTAVAAVVDMSAAQSGQAQYDCLMYKSKFKSLGISQVSLGISCVICGIIIAVYYTASNGSGFWGGLWFIATGAVCIASSMRPRKYIIIAGMTLAVISIIMSVAIVIVDAMLAADFGRLISFSSPIFDSPSFDFGFFGPNYIPTVTPIILTSMHALLAVLAFANMVVAIRYCFYCYRSGFGQVFHENPAVSFKGSAGTVPTVVTPNYGQIPPVHQNNM